MNETVSAIRRYTTAYHNLHGRFPNIRSNNGWIKLNNFSKSLRPFEVMEMAANLERRAAESNTTERQNRSELIRRIMMERETEDSQESSVWDVREELHARVQAQIQEETKAVFETKDDMHTQIRGWKDHVNKDSMIMFLNRLFEVAGNSAFMMQRMMDDFIETGHFSNRVDCDECDVKMELENLYDSLERKEEIISDYKDRVLKRNNMIGKLENKVRSLRKEIMELKSNSIIFSMDEI